MKYSTVVEVDENGEYFIKIPDELIQELGWVEGDILQWAIEGDSVILSKKVDDNDKSDSSN